VSDRKSQVGKHATTVATGPDGFTVVTYHSTQVVRFNHKKIKLDTGGRQTVTTRARMNQASNQYVLGFRVFQKNFELFAEFKGRTLPFKGHTITLNR
jgi:hypothetical protein